MRRIAAFRNGTVRFASFWNFLHCNHNITVEEWPLSSHRWTSSDPDAGRQFLFFLPDVILSQHPELDVHLFSAARPSSFGGDVVSCEAGWHGFRKVGCSGSSNSGAYPNLPRDILCLTYGMAEAPSHCPSPHQRIHLSRAYTKARSPTIQK